MTLPKTVYAAEEDINDVCVEEPYNACPYFTRVVNWVNELYDFGASLDPFSDAFDDPLEQTIKLDLVLPWIPAKEGVVE